jgi:hypothetical protein
MCAIAGSEILSRKGPRRLLSAAGSLARESRGIFEEELLSIESKTRKGKSPCRETLTDSCALTRPAISARTTNA